MWWRLKNKITMMKIVTPATLPMAAPAMVPLPSRGNVWDVELILNN
jgi:hypothetical protein